MTNSHATWLREQAAWLDASMGYVAIPAARMRDAADEIERLRAKITSLDDVIDYWKCRAGDVTASEPSGCPEHGMEHFFEGMCIKCGVVPAVKSNLTPGPIEPMPPDYIVQCRCGWMGNVSALKSLPDFKRGCPRCSAEFKPFAPQPFELPPLRDDDPYRQCSVCGRKSWDEPDIQAICLMPQPNRTRCPGVLRPAQRTNDAL